MAVTINGTTGITTPDVNVSDELTITDGTATHTISTDSFSNLTLYSDQSTSEYINYKGGIGHIFRVGDTSVTDTSGSEAMRIDSSGNLLVGKTTAGLANDGIELRAGNQIFGTANGDAPLVLNRNTSDGNIVLFRKDNTTAGFIGTAGGATELFIGSSATNGNGIYFGNTDRLIPVKSGNVSDNTQDIGHPSYRWDDIYATNGTIQTSDRNEKQDIEELSEAEQRVAVAAKGLLRKFRWIKAVEEKGDDARIHFGIIAQDLQAAFEAEGLDAGRYAMFISTTWWETQTEVPAVEAVEAVLDDEGNVIEEAVEAKEAYTRTDTYFTAEEAPEGAVERTRLGVRYPELLAFIIGAL